MKDDISKALFIIRNSPTLEDESIYKELLTRGLKQELAARLVEFLPLVYGRQILAAMNLRFPDKFKRRLPDGSISAERPFSSEPLWEEVTMSAREEISRGTSADELLAIGGRSAEFNVVNQLLNQGSKPEDIRLTPIVFTWPEKGPSKV